MATSDDRVEREAARLQEIAERRVRSRTSLTLDVASSIDDAAQMARLTPTNRITSGRPVIGPVIVLLKHLIQKVTSWVVGPIADQQTAYNEAVVRALHQLRAENAALRRLLEQEISSDRSA